jgi:hypothetical protein
MDARVAPHYVPHASPRSLQPSDGGEHGRLIRTLADRFAATRDWGALLRLGDAYRTGSFPACLPDDDMALRCYAACARGEDPMSAGAAQARFVETRLEPVPDSDRAGAAAPREPGLAAVRLATRLAAEGGARWSKPASHRLRLRSAVVPMAADGRGADADELRGLAGVLDLLPTDFQRMFGKPYTEAAPRAFPAPPRPGHAPPHARPSGPPRTAVAAGFGSDAQNVHDHGVSATVARNAAELLRRCAAAAGRGPGQPPDSRVCDRAREEALDAALRSDMSEAEKTAVLQVLDTLGGERHSRFEVSERQLLALAWEFVAALDAGQRADMQRNICKQLAGAVERGKTVCSTGKMARVVAAFDGTGLLGTAVVPMAAVRQELGDMAARAREKHGGEPGSALSAVADRFAADARRLYVDGLGLSAAVVGPLIDVYADALREG